MIQKDRYTFQNKKVAVLGYGIEGKDVVSFLEEEEAQITIFDKKNKEELDLEGVDLQKVKLSLGDSYLNYGLESFDVVVRSPGFYRYSNVITSAEKAGVKITSAVQIFFENSPAKIIGVTGTKGKGTTATLIYNILKKDDKKVFLGGNIGKPYLELLDILDSDSWVVMELSSFQLIDLNISPHIAVVLNITSDHLDWHSSIQEYASAKRNIAKHQTDNDFTVINADYETSKNFDGLGYGKKYYFSRQEKVKGCFVRDGYFISSIESEEEIVGGTKDLILKGRHNWENVSAAICASLLSGAKISTVQETIKTFKGLEHRLEYVDEIEGRKFYNDSFSTGPQSAIAAIKSFTEPETLILGGSEKGLEFNELADEISKLDNIKNILLIGTVASKIKEAIKNSKYIGNIFDLGKPSMAEIVKQAYNATHSGGVVILTPAAASFDMFENYKDRGNQFKKSVEALKDETNI